MRKIISFILAVIMVAVLTVSVCAAGFPGVVSAESVLVLDASNSRKLFAKDANVTVEPAGTTKLMTALVAFENTKDLSEEITVTEDDLEGVIEGNDLTLMPMLEPGETLTMKDVLCGLLIASGNDAAVCAAVHSAGSLEAFVELMNKKAQELGMASTHFANPHGKSDEEHYTTAEDMSKLALAVLNEPELMAIISRKNYTIPETVYNAQRELTNSNLLLTGNAGQSYAYATGMLGGYTSNAGGCLVSSAEKDGHKLICLVFGDRDSGADRWELTAQLLDYCFGSYKTYSAEELLKDVLLSSDNNTPITPDFSGITITVPDIVDLTNISAKFTIPEGEKSGTGSIKYYAQDGTLLATVPFTFGTKKANTEEPKSRSVGKVIKTIIIIVIILAVLFAAFLILRASNGKKKYKAKHIAEKPAPKHRVVKNPEQNSKYRALFRRYFPTISVFLVLAIIVVVIVLLFKKCGA